jgi:PAS domain S-box-containing protein
MTSVYSIELWLSGPPGGAAAPYTEVGSVNRKEPAYPKLAEAQEHFRLLVSGVEDYAIFLLDTDGIVISWNAGAERINGYLAEEIVGKHFSAFYRPEDVQAEHPRRELEIARREGHYREEGWRVRKDGTLFWASVVLNAVRNPDGEIGGFLKITRDLTERRLADEALRQSEERFRLLVDVVEDYAIFMLDPQGNIASWNRGAERIKGYRADEIIGRHFSTFYRPEDVQSGHPQDELAVARSEGRYQEEGWRVRKDGSLFWADVTITAIRDDLGTLRGFAKVTRDLTQRRAAEQQQLQLFREQAARAEAEKANQIKDEFMAVLSHELRTPLNAIVGWAHLLRAPERLPPEQVARGLEAIERNATIQTQIVSDVLDISRITSGKVRLSPRGVDLRDVVAAAVDTTRLAAEAKRIDLQATLPADPQFAWADADRLQQVVLNLLANAVKFTPSGGRVEATLATRGSRIELTVRDNGIGIGPEFLPHVFESFRQADSSSSRSHGGLGLGLAIVKRLVELHGGRVTAQSEGEGRGTAMTVTLPVLPVTAAAPSAHASETPATRLDGLSILLVEDHADSRDLLIAILEGLGGVVYPAASAAEGLGLLRKARPDVLVSDLEMPGESGYVLIQKIRALPPEAGGLTPAIALTAYARADERMQALASGFQAHLAKPALPEQLAAAIAGVVAWTRG